MDPFAGVLDEPDSLHKYLYVGNDPVNLTDPSGMAEYVEHSQRSKEQVKQTTVHHNKHGRDIACRTIRTSSEILITAGSVPGLEDLFRTAVDMALGFCPCDFRGAPSVQPLVEWLADAPELLQAARDWYQNFPQWQGIDPDRTPVKYVPQDEVRRIRGMPGESGGHHPHPLALGGPPGQTLTPTGDTRTWKNPTHTRVHREVHGPITKKIKRRC
jgi:hypothetical protein